MVNLFDYKAGSFVWDLRKEALNVLRHGLNFTAAAFAFEDPHCLILEDVAHSGREARFFCVGRAAGAVITVRFTYREGRIRIFGAGSWTKWRKLYEKRNSLR